MSTHVAWMEVPRRSPDVGAAARSLLHLEIAGLLGVGVDRVSTGSVCARCGGHHGQPVARVDGRPGPHVSLSRGSGLVVTAVSTEGPVGVDAERRGAARADDLRTVLLHPDEAASTDIEMTTTWVRKEAVLKATGQGLTVDPRRLRLTDAGSPPAVLGWEDAPSPARIWLRDLKLPDPYVGCVALIADTAPEVTVRAADPAAVRRTARS